MASADKPGSACCAAIQSIAAACIVLLVLNACANEQNGNPLISAARIEQVRFTPLENGILYPGSELRIEMRYLIQAGDRLTDGDYFAAIEVASPDQGFLFLHACGGEPRRSLERASGHVTLRCRMRLDPYHDAHSGMLMRVRIYQRTDPARSVMIASSDAAAFQLRAPAIEPWQQIFMERCPATGDRDGSVRVCRG
ncbi:MAG: hypothetical protein WBP60_02495 [Gammaproteobacteria bacterium]